MESNSFNLHQTVHTILLATKAIVCHMLFDFALHGIILCLILGLVSLYLASRNYKYTHSIRKVAKRVFVFCSVVAMPGFISLLIDHKLPDAGLFNFNSVGMLGFWSLISVHLVFEEINNTLVREKTSLSS